MTWYSMDDTNCTQIARSPQRRNKTRLTPNLKIQLQIAWIVTDFEMIAPKWTERKANALHGAGFVVREASVKFVAKSFED